ncbi:MAG TPA: arginase family protein [Thermoanaerobaculia bacterium]|jgi:arginase|nr:arginase family protein [Thermoanaerobaculia bacterium]
MSGLPLDLIVVPFDVERRDTSAARAPGELLARGFPDRLRGAGFDVRQTLVEPFPLGQAKSLRVTLIGCAIAKDVALARSQGRFPLILSGGCLAAVGVVAGLQQAGIDPAVLWIDAHGDFNNPESSPSGYWDGMALAAVCGVSLPDLRGLVPGFHPLAVDRVLHVAGRAFDPLETGNVRRHGLALVPPDELAGEQARERLRHLTGAGNFYLHVDLDGLDPRDAPAVSFPEPDGARLDDVLATLGALPPPAAMTFSALSFERADAEEAERTVATCLRLVETFARV